MDIHNGIEEKICDVDVGYPSGFAFRPRGNLAWASGGAIITVDFQGNQEVLLNLSDMADTYISELLWSPDNESIALLLDSEDSEDIFLIKGLDKRKR